MTTKAVQVRAATLAGTYGDVFWTMEPVMVYVAGSEIYARIYVGNPTDTDREYMLMASVSRIGVLITEFPIKVDDGTWFDVEAGNVVSLPGALEVAYTDVVLTLNLYERVQNDIVDSVASSLISAGIGLPFPGVPSPIDNISDLMTMMIFVMMITIMMKAMEGEEGEKKYE